MTQPDEWSYEVIENIYIGSLISAQNLKNINKFGINVVLSLGCNLEFSNQNIEHMALEYILDTPEQCLLNVWDKTNAFIQSNLDKNKKILIHCVYGQSRSAATICAYLISILKYEIDTALKLLKQVRPSLCINPGFLCQLYHLSVYGFSSSIIKLTRHQSNNNSNNKSNSNNNNNSNNSNIATADKKLSNLNQLQSIDTALITDDTKYHTSTTQESLTTQETGIYCSSCRVLLAIQQQHEIIDQLDYSSFLNQYIDDFWKDYVPNHTLPKSWFTQYPLEGYTLISGFPVISCNNNHNRNSDNNNNRNNNKNRKNNKRKISNFQSSSSSSSMKAEDQQHDLLCPSCDANLGFFKQNGLLICHKFLKINLYALNNNYIIRLPCNNNN